MFLFAMLTVISTYANNIQVQQTLLTGQNLGTQTYQIEFDLSWENSWRTSTLESNWDAAWVFVKYRIDGTTDWQHAKLQPTGFVAPVGATVEPRSDGMGAFIYRNSDGIGDLF